MSRIGVVLGVLWAAVVPAQAVTAADTMAICRNAAIRAADAHAIPREVMVAITLVETRTRRDGVSGPWPWTVNVAGKGDWFDSRAAALVHAQRALNGGEKSFDVGCFQLNYRWHGQHFASIDQMFEPTPSGDYAARFLKSLHAETGDWIKAAGLYHSRTKHHARRYRGLVAKTVRRMGGNVPEEVAVARAPAASKAPLILRVGEAGAGALVQNGVRVPRGMAQSSGSVGTQMLRPARGGLILRPGREG